MTIKKSNGWTLCSDRNPSESGEYLTLNYVNESGNLYCPQVLMYSAEENCTGWNIYSDNCEHELYPYAWKKIVMPVMAEGETK